MPDYSQMGLASGLVPSRDTTNIDPKILAMMAIMRRKNGDDNTPKVNVLDDIKAANEGKRVAPVPDSTIQMAHTDWLKHIDNLGYQLTPKPKQ